MKTRNISKKPGTKSCKAKCKVIKSNSLKTKSKEPVSYRDSHNLGRRKSTESVVTYSLNSRLFFDVYAKYGVEDNKKVENLNNSVSSDEKTVAVIESSNDEVTPVKASKRKLPDDLNDKTIKPKLQKLDNNNKASEIKDESFVSKKSKMLQELIESKTVFKKHLSRTLPGVNNKKIRASLTPNKEIVKENGLSSNKSFQKDNLTPPKIVPSKSISSKNSVQSENESIQQETSIKIKSTKQIKKSRKSNNTVKELPKPNLASTSGTRVKRVASLNAAAIISCVHNHESNKITDYYSEEEINNENESKVKQEAEKIVKPIQNKPENGIKGRKKKTSIKDAVKTEPEVEVKQSEKEIKMKKKNDVSETNGILEKKIENKNCKSGDNENSDNCDVNSKPDVSNMFFDITKRVKQKKVNKSLELDLDKSNGLDKMKKEVIVNGNSNDNGNNNNGNNITNNNLEGAKKPKKKRQSKKCMVDEIDVKSVEQVFEEKDDSFWLWDGEGQIQTIQLQSKGEFQEKLCYRAIKHSRDDVIINTNDCVLMRSDDANELPFIGKISAFFNDDVENKKMMAVYWYYRPENTELGRLNWHGENDLYASQHLDSNCVDCIEDKAFVLPVEMFARFSALQRRQNSSSRPSLTSRLIPVNNDDLSVPCDFELRPEQIINSKSRNYHSTAQNSISNLYFANMYQGGFPPEMAQSNVFCCRGLYDIYNNNTSHNLPTEAWIVPSLPHQNRHHSNGDNNNTQIPTTTSKLSSSCATTPCCQPSLGLPPTEVTENNVVNTTSIQSTAFNHDHPPISPSDSAMSISSSTNEIHDTQSPLKSSSQVNPPLPDNLPSPPPPPPLCSPPSPTNKFLPPITSIQ